VRVRIGLGAKPNKPRSHRAGDSVESQKAAALRVAQAAFEGVTPLLIEHGVTSPEAEALLRAVCVHVVAKNESDEGRRPNVSRVSMKTGVDRHTVAALLKAPPETEARLNSRRDSMSRVIDGWLLDPEYSEKGSPKDLDIGDPGSNGHSVWTLVQRYAPGVWPRLVIDELIRVDYVDTLPNGKLRCKGAENPKTLYRQVIREGDRQRMRDALRALLHDVTEPVARHVWRTAQSLDIGEQDLPLVRKMLRDRLDSMFAWMAEELNSVRWHRGGSEGGAKTRVGLSGFTFEEVLPKEVGNEHGAKFHRSKA